MKKVFNTTNFEKIKNIVFYIAVAFIPFDNLFFAPASGWAAITPLILVLYIILNIDCWWNTIKKYWYVLAVFVVIVLFSIIHYFTLQFNFSNTLNAFISLGLGAVCLLALDIFFRQKNHKIKELIPILIGSYSISMCFGIFQFIALKTNTQWMINFADFMAKRSYIMEKKPRVQFSFTEPSFISVHMFGILLPIYLLTKDKRILVLLLSFLTLALLIASTVRLYLDVLVVFGIFVLIYIIKNIKKKSTIVLLFLALIIGGSSTCYLYNKSERVHNIFTKGVYADGSLAARYFRVQSAVYGYQTDTFHFLFGYGIGNALIPIRQGYDRARPTYKNESIREVNQLGDPNHQTDSDTICMYVRIISEFGLLPSLILLYMIFRKSLKAHNIPMFIVMAYLYIQFESYAFYGLWILVVANNYLIDKKEKISQLEKASENIDDNSLVSIIVPIYNCENYLNQCLDSLVNQTYGNLEIILINDGSKDNSEKICLDYANKFNYIKYYKYDNAGVSSARNKGIDKCNGDYIAFVDSDDYVDSNYISRIIYAMKESNKDIGVTKYKRLYGKSIDHPFLNNNESINEDSTGYLNNVLNVQTAIGMCTGKIYKASLIKDNNIKFNENLKVGEDALFNANLTKYSNGYVDLNSDLYNYRLNNNSLVRKYDINYKDKYYDAMVAMNEFSRENGNYSVDNYIMYHVLLICVNYCCNPKNEYNYKQRIQSIKDLRKEELFDKAINNSNYSNLSLTRKITLFTLKHKMYWLTTMICDFRQLQFKRG